MTKKKGRKPKSHVDHATIIHVVNRERFGSGVAVLFGSSEAYRLRDGAPVRPKRNLSAAFRRAEAQLRSMGLIGKRVSDGIIEPGAAARQSYYRARRERSRRSELFRKLLIAEYRARKLKVPRFAKRKRMSKRDIKIAFAVEVRLREIMD